MKTAQQKSAAEPVVHAEMEEHPVPVQPMTQAEMISSLEHHATYYRVRAMDLEEKLVATQAELKRHSVARIRAETELAQLKAATATKQ